MDDLLQCNHKLLTLNKIRLLIMSSHNHGKLCQNKVSSGFNYNKLTMTPFSLQFPIAICPTPLFSHFQCSTNTSTPIWTRRADTKHILNNTTHLPDMCVGHCPIRRAFMIGVFTLYNPFPVSRSHARCMVNFWPQDHAMCPSSTKQASDTWPLSEPPSGSPRSIQTPSGVRVDRMRR